MAIPIYRVYTTVLCDYRVLLYSMISPMEHAHPHIKDDRATSEGLQKKTDEQIHCECYLQ